MGHQDVTGKQRGFHMGALLFAQRGFLQKVERGEHAIQRGAHFVAHIGKEPRPVLHRLQRGVAGLFEFVGAAMFVGDIADIGNEYRTLAGFGHRHREFHREFAAVRAQHGHVDLALFQNRRLPGLQKPFEVVFHL